MKLFLLLLCSLTLSSWASWINLVRTDSLGGICVASGLQGKSEFERKDIFSLEELDSLGKTSQQLLITDSLENYPVTLACQWQWRNYWDVLLTDRTYGDNNTYLNFTYIHRDAFGTGNGYASAWLVPGLNWQRDNSVSYGTIYLYDYRERNLRYQVTGYSDAYHDMVREQETIWAINGFLNECRLELYASPIGSPPNLSCFEINLEEDIDGYSYYITKIALDFRGRLWLADNHNEIWLRNNEDSSWTKTNVGFNVREIVPRDSDVVEFFSSDIGRQGIVTPLYRATWKNGNLSTEAAGTQKLSILRCPKPGRCWAVEQTLATGKAKLFREEGNERTRTFELDTLVLDLSEDHLGRLWIGTLTGLMQLDTATGVVTPIKVETTAVLPEKSSAIRTVQGQWLGNALRAQIPAAGLVNVRNVQGRLLASQSVKGNYVEFHGLPKGGLYVLEWRAGAL